MTDHARSITRLAIDPALVLRRLNDWREFIERRVPAHAPNERRLQDEIEAKLRPETGSSHSRSMRREHVLTERDRIDFLIQETVWPTDARFGIGIEVKVDGTLSELVRQLQRYAQHDLVDGLLVVSTRARLHAVPTTLSGKPVAVALLLHGGL